MRVKGDEVYMDFGEGLQRIDTVDEWETFAGRITALMMDPRWLIARLEDLEINQENGNIQLKGNFYPGKNGLVSQELLKRLETEPKDSILREFQLSLDIQSDDDDLTAEEQKKAKQKLQEYEQLSVEDIKELIRTDMLRPYDFTIVIDKRLLPISIKIPTGLLRSLTSQENPEVEVSFSYAPTQAAD